MSDLDKLKDLLFGAEKQVLDSITERVESRELRSADVADILPEAIHASHAQGSELRESLREPVGQCLQREFRASLRIRKCGVRYAPIQPLLNHLNEPTADCFPAFFAEHPPICLIWLISASCKRWQIIS